MQTASPALSLDDGLPRCFNRYAARPPLLTFRFQKPDCIPVACWLGFSHFGLPSNYDRIAEKRAGVGIFFNSAQGGMVTADNRRPNGEEARDWAECNRIGRLLADEALRIVSSVPTQESPALFCASKQITLPVDSPSMRALLSQLPGLEAAPKDAVSTQLNLLNVGAAQILTIQVEALPNIGYYLKRKTRGEHNLLFGLANDAFGYILTKEDFDSFHRYEYVTRTSLGERTADTSNVSASIWSPNPLPRSGDFALRPGTACARHERWLL